MTDADQLREMAKHVNAAAEQLDRAIDDQRIAAVLAAKPYRPEILDYLAAVDDVREAITTFGAVLARWKQATR